MWYRIAAYGTIDLQKYIPEKLGEDFDVDSVTILVSCLYKAK